MICLKKNSLLRKVQEGYLRWKTPRSKNNLKNFCGCFFLNKLMFICDTKPLRMLAPVTSAFPGMYTWRLQQRSLRNFNSIKFLTADCRHARCAARCVAQSCACAPAQVCVEISRRRQELFITALLRLLSTSRVPGRAALSHSSHKCFIILYYYLVCGNSRLV